MTRESLKNKTGRYLYGKVMPAEQKQIQNWLSCTNPQRKQEDNRELIEMEILEEIRSYTAYPLFHPKQEPWWKKITAFL